MVNELIFVDPNVSKSDIDLFLGPITSEDPPLQSIEPGWTMAHLLHSAGLFPSIKQAKKNGFDKPIRKGFDELTVGKQRLKIFTLTIFD